VSHDLLTVPYPPPLPFKPSMPDACGAFGIIPGGAMTELDPESPGGGARDPRRGAPPVHDITRESNAVPEGVVLLVLGGELDLASAPELREHLEAAMDEGARRVVLDLAEVEFMDSSMLKELLRANAELETGGAKLVLAGPQPPTRRLLDLTRTTDLFEITDDRASALAG
jgi:anti-sigma B factor antagonist